MKEQTILLLMAIGLFIVCAQIIRMTSYGNTLFGIDGIIILIVGVLIFGRRIPDVFKFFQDQLRR